VVTTSNENEEFTKKSMIDKFSDENGKPYK